jgi:hypothetical protein
MSLKHVVEVSHGLVDCKELHVLGVVFLLLWAEFPGKEDEGLPDALHSLLEDSTYGSSLSVGDQGGGEVRSGYAREAA